MNVTLTTAERDLMVSTLKLPAHIVSKLCSATPSADRINVAVSEEEAIAIHDLCGEAFQDVGLAEDQEPNPTGLILEHLVDKFFTG